VALLGITGWFVPAESESAPREGAKVEAPSSSASALARTLSSRGMRNLLLPCFVGRRGAAGPVVVCAGGVVVATACGVGKGVVGVVDGLEALCARGAFRRIRWYTIGVVLQGGFLVCIADLLLGGFGVDVEDLVVVLCCCEMLVRCEALERMRLTHGGRLCGSGLREVRTRGKVRRRLCRWVGMCSWIACAGCYVKAQSQGGVALGG
jgi:hypothetical protein